jgi:hypothetical protein
VAKSVQKITLSSSRDIPFDKLLLSQSNVRHVKAGVSIEELAEDIARRGLLMGLSVRAVTDEAGACQTARNRDPLSAPKRAPLFYGAAWRRGAEPCVAQRLAAG